MFLTRLETCAQAARACLHGRIHADGALDEAMRYATRGGKGLRAFLVMEGARLHGIGGDVSVWPAAAVEAVHGYSLVHDDLPCMDDDDLRRGQPTVHVKWDQATAVLTGDALLTLAFELLVHDSLGAARVPLVASMSKAAGQEGMVHGQALDIAAETAGQVLTLEEVTALQAGKTGALIGWSAEAGARLAGADPASFARYGTNLGLAFQIADDVLDVEGDAAKLGKGVGKDARAGKATFVSLMGLEPAKARARELADAACDALSSYGRDADTLRAAAQFVISRDA